MGRIRYITDDNNNKKSLVIDLKDIEKHSDEVHDIIDMLVAESRKGEETVSLSNFKKELKTKGKL